MIKSFKPIESGTVFNKLTVLSITDQKDYRGYKYNVICECGNKLIVPSYRLKSGNTKSCGCLRVINMSTHGKYKLKSYRAWMSMIDRCCNEKSKSFKNYGARGIRVSDSWKNLDNFLNDMGEPEKELSLERIDNNKGYSKENCKWATHDEQSQNRRTSILVNINGAVASVSKHCRELGISNRLVYRLIKKGLSPESAFVKAKEISEG